MARRVSETDTDSAAHAQEKMRIEFEPGMFIEPMPGDTTPNAGLLVPLKLDRQLGFTWRLAEQLHDPRRGKNRVYLPGCELRQSIFSRLAGYADYNDSVVLGEDCMIKMIVSGCPITGKVASTSQIFRYESVILSEEENLKILTKALGWGIDDFNRAKPGGQNVNKKRRKSVRFDMDSTMLPMYGRQEGAKWNGHYRVTGIHPNIITNQDGQIEILQPRPGNVHTADGAIELLDEVLERYPSEDGYDRYFCGDAGYAGSKLYCELEERGVNYSVRLPKNSSVIKLLSPSDLIAPIDVTSATKIQTKYINLKYQAQSWNYNRRVVAKLEWDPMNWMPRIHLIVTNINAKKMSGEQVFKFYNQRGKIEQCIKDAKRVMNFARLSCKSFASNHARLLLHAITYNFMNFVSQLNLPKPLNNLSMKSLRNKLIKRIGRITSHSGEFTWQIKEDEVTVGKIGEILNEIQRSHHRWNHLGICPGAPFCIDLTLPVIQIICSPDSTQAGETRWQLPSPKICATWQLHCTGRALRPPRLLAD